MHELKIFVNALPFFLCCENSPSCNDIVKLYHATLEGLLCFTHLAAALLPKDSLIRRGVPMDNDNVEA